MWNWLTDKTSGTPSTATASFALSGTQQKALCIAKEAIWPVCLKMPCQIFWHVCACVWLNLTVTFGLFFSCIYSVSFIIKPSPFVRISFSLTLKKGSQSLPVFLCTNLGFLTVPATFCSFVSWSKSNIKCKSCQCEPMLFKWKETSSLYIQFRYQIWSLRAASACHPHPDRIRGAVMFFWMYVTWSNTCPQQNTHTQSSEFDPTPVTLHEHTYCFIIVLLFSSI